MESFTIQLNGKEKKIYSKTLELLIDKEGFNPLIVATAVNGVFIAREKRADLQLKQNDTVEIVSPMQGG
ncbi:hypothetical protein B488_01040 [Liberibacter crescens BT-1]|uniref:Sulfur carrier protein ThiS n=1 Tax=Liberibacter crescens (strain BT-1) TaxID=1215343 RepID=L0ET32_LIBCB|nr:sulfur carrier protein ThiS [Liberibacter crescens]AGA64097.1 hypothetical protein B488_01040 [Liberibacter crescens BT-1]AMC12381.1 hypothetical protein RL73_00690 [Liberibacter crescens]